MTPARTAADKPALRRALLSRRAALSAQERAGAGQAAVAALAGCAAARVAAYVSVGTEPATAALLAAFADREVLLPVLLPDDGLDWARADAGVAPGRHGLLEPRGDRLGPDAVTSCDLVVVPALAVDRTGTRLGRGGGSYDRALAGASGWIVALLHDGELVDELPAEPHDQRVHAVVTPRRGLVRLRPHPGDGSAGGVGTMEP